MGIPEAASPVREPEEKDRERRMSEESFFLIFEKATEKLDTGWTRYLHCADHLTRRSSDRNPATVTKVRSQDFQV